VPLFQRSQNLTLRDIKVAKIFYDTQTKITDVKDMPRNLQKFQQCVSDVYPEIPADDITYIIMRLQSVGLIWQTSSFGTSWLKITDMFKKLIKYINEPERP